MAGTPELLLEKVIPAQHHERPKSMPIDFRDVTYGVRMERRRTSVGEEAHHGVEAGTIGDMTTGVFWQTADEKLRPIGGWRYGAWPAIASSKSTALPVGKLGLTGTWLADTRFEELGVSTYDGAALIPGEPILVLDTQNEDEQEPIAFRWTSPPMIVHWRNEEPGTLSTIWYDIDDKDKIDGEHRFAHTHTLFRITGFGPGPAGTVDPFALTPQTIALNLTLGPEIADPPTAIPIPGGGVVIKPGKVKTAATGFCYFYGKTPGADDPRVDTPAVPPTPAVAPASWEEFGPFSVGYGEADPHYLYTNDGKLGVSPLSFVTNQTSFHTPGPTGLLRKGPMEFSASPYFEGKDESVRVKVYMSFDEGHPGAPGKGGEIIDGAWRFWTTTVNLPPEPGEGGGGGMVTFGGGGAAGAYGGSGGGPIPGPQTAAAQYRGRAGTGVYLDFLLGNRYGKPSQTHLADLRYASDQGDLARAQLAVTPVTWRAQTFGAREARDTWLRSRRGPRKYYRGGAGPGGEMFADPIVQLAMVEDQSLPAKYESDLSGASFWLCHASLWFGNRYLSKTGTPADGWKQVLAADGDLCFLPFDAAGAADPQRTLKIQGNATVAGLHNIFNFHRVTAGDTITIPSRQQMGIHGLLTVEAGGVLAISPDGQLAVRP